MIKKVKAAFKKRYDGEPSIYCAPGRVNLIGEHTDYNLGFVLPGAIDKAIYIAIEPTSSSSCKIYSIDYDAEILLDLDGSNPEHHWAKYIFGVVQEMRKRGAKINGFNCAFGGDVPLGAGLSSSAALESVFAFALNDIYKSGFDLQTLAKIGQMTEHNYVGVMCGIMDQFASLHGKEGKVIRLDCRSLEYELIPFNPVGHKVVLIDSMVTHSLASTEYNVRRQQCEEGVAIVAKHESGIESLRDVSLEMLNKYKNEMKPIVYQRCAYVINENQRLLDGCKALQKDDFKTFGEKMYGSHDGLSKEYEVSCPELDYIVDISRKHDGVLGARMMGGGFGGCVIHVIEEDAYDAYITDVTSQFKSKFGKTPRIIDVVIGDGARKIE